jgi:hypothetical protein
MTVVKDEACGPDWTLYNADTVDLLPGLPDKSIDLSVFSPPFSSLYTYSASDRDMGNCRDDAEFLQHYSFIARELLRVTKPGRLCAVHCKDLVDYAGSAGRAGLRDFPGGIIRVHEEAGWKFHARTTVWKSPVTEMQRTKAHGLLYKQLRSDSTFSRMGLPDYVLFFRRWAEDGEEVAPVTHTPETFPLDQWQEWASPVWMTIDQTDVLNVEQARADKDEKHMCPLQLDLIERVVRMYSNPGDVVFSPFAGIGSEGYVSLRCDRKFVGVELKPEYWRWGIKNLTASRAQGAFTFLPADATASLPAPIPPPQPAPSVDVPEASGRRTADAAEVNATNEVPHALAKAAPRAAGPARNGTPAAPKRLDIRFVGEDGSETRMEVDRG